jgi:hypothetical protein
MEFKTDDEKKQIIKQQTNQIFNIAEQPVMQYISEFLNEEPSVLFKDNIPDIAEPLILLPLEDYKKNIYVKFTLNSTHTDNDIEFNKQRIAKINSMIKHEKVKEGIGFLYYCIKSVYASILTASVINNSPLINLKILLDDVNWLFYLQFSHESTYKKLFYQDVIQNIMDSKSSSDKLDKQQQQQINKEFVVAVNELNKLKITPEIEKLEVDMNKSYEQKVKLCICIEDITEDELPKQKNNKVNNQNIINNIHDLPIIKGGGYK